MNRSFFYHNFRHWLKVNRSKFAYFPYISQVRKNTILVQFHGLKSKLTVCISRSGSFDVFAMKSLESAEFELIAEFDLYVQRESRGYCLVWPSDEFKGKYYLSRKDLYREHCYNRFLEWFNQNIQHHLQVG